jgi:hypothetical protein
MEDRSMFDGDSVSFLAQTFRGELIRPGDHEYGGARALYNAMIDKRPALIACCRDVADVIAPSTSAVNTISSLRFAAAGTTAPASGAAMAAW